MELDQAWMGKAAGQGHLAAPAVKPAEDLDTGPQSPRKYRIFHQPC